MAAYRCSTCSINYPSEERFNRTCPVCDGRTGWHFAAQPDDDWAWKATMLQQRHEDDPLRGAIPVLPVTVREDSGEFWIDSRALVGLGFTRALLVDDVIEIPDGVERNDDAPCDSLWEVMGYRDSSREYWIRPLRVPDVVSDAG